MEVYNPESPDIGSAEIIVAKHRNGPTGTVRLGGLATTQGFEYESLPRSDTIVENMFLGPDLIPFLLLALGAALVVATVDMIKPLEPRTENELRRPSRS